MMTKLVNSFSSRICHDTTTGTTSLQPLMPVGHIIHAVNAFMHTWKDLLKYILSSP